MDVQFWAQILVGLVGVVLALIPIIKYKKKKRENKPTTIIPGVESGTAKQDKAGREAIEKYCETLKEELGFIHILGSPDIESNILKLNDAFVSLRIRQSRGNENGFAAYEKMGIDEVQPGLSPGDLMKLASGKRYRLLLVIGSPGSGKTTLLKYYAINCLDKTHQNYRQLGFTGEVLPIYFPLRELKFGKEDDKPLSLSENLEKWSGERELNVSAKQFHSWLRTQKTLVLLDGLDEIGNKKRRQKACQWIKNMCIGFKNANFVVTSRETGYRKLDGIEFEMPHLRVEIMDFSPQQQAEFLKKWFRAVFLTAELPPKDIPGKQWRQQQEKRAHQKSKKIIEFLNREDNKAVQELAAVPMLLQIMAIIWKDRRHFPKSRTALYDAAINYILEYRDRLKNIEPILPAEEARRVLAPAALWMQEELEKDEIPKKTMHQLIQVILDTMEGLPKAVIFCENLRDRAGLIVDYDREHYAFRHKSFREFLSALQLIEDSHHPNRIKSLIKHFKEDWWEETLRFFMNKSNDKIFDRFMRLFFQSKVSRQLDANHQTLLQDLIRESPQKKIDALVESLNSDNLNNNQRRYVLDCLKTIGTPGALKVIKEVGKTKWDRNNRAYAADIIAETLTKPGILIKNREEPGPRFTRHAFRNPDEGNVEYIKIPGGTYQYSVSKKIVTVPDLYICKYPVTNKRYRRFISFLAGKEKNIGQELPFDMFVSKLWEFAVTIKGYAAYLGETPTEWHKKLRSRYDKDKKFNKDDQPVVAINWYAARSYCFWISCLEAARNRDIKLKNRDVKWLASLYRLPTETQWEWAAGGKSGGSIREYPWSEDKGKPSPTFANYGNLVGAATPVGRYPEGATPQGLMDMAGNVWEWMENYYDEDQVWFALRGGSWRLGDRYLRCTARLNPAFRSDDLGFRVMRSIGPNPQ